MSEHWAGPGWWFASDGNWYPPLDGDSSSTPEATSPTVEHSEPVASNETTPAPFSFASKPAADAVALPAETEAVDIDLTGGLTLAEAAKVHQETSPYAFSVARPLDEEIPAAGDSEVIDLDALASEEAAATVGADVLIGTGLRDVPLRGPQSTPGAAPQNASVSADDGDAIAAGWVSSATSTGRSRVEGDRPASVTRQSVGPAVGSQPESESEPDLDPESRASGVGTQRRADFSNEDEGGLASPDSENAESPEASEAEQVPPGNNVLDDSTFWADEKGRRGRRETPLFIAAVALAILSGVLGALWLAERSTAEELRSGLEAEPGQDLSTSIEELEGEINTLRVQNAQLEQQLTDMSALVLELPAGRVTEIDVPLAPVFADEENGRLIAIDAAGEYVVFGDGVESPITDSGSIGSAPTGLFAATARAWISTESGQIDVVALGPNVEERDNVEFGPVSFLAEEARGYWAFDPLAGQLVRLRKTDGAITDTVDVPVDIVDLTIGAGSVWALGDDNIVYRVNTADLTVQPIDGGEDLISITAGPDALWTLSAADGSLRRIDPVTGAVLVTVPVGRDPIDVTFAENSVWVALRSGSSLIEVDTLTSAVVSRTELASEPAALHQGQSGVFVTTVGEGSPLLRIASLVEASDPAGDGEVDPSVDGS